MFKQIDTAQAEEATVTECELLETQNVDPSQYAENEHTSRDEPSYLPKSLDEIFAEEDDDDEEEDDWYEAPHFLESCWNNVCEAVDNGVDWVKENPAKATVGAIGLAGLVYAGIQLFSRSDDE